MSIQYSGGTLINVSFTQSTGTRGELAGQIITQLLNAGWVNVSGSSNDQVLKCVATTAGVTGLQLAVRVYDPGSGNCARVALRNVSGTRIGQDLYLLPAASKTWRIICNQYQFFCMTAGSSATREFVYAGQLIVPSFLGTTVNCGFALGNATSDTDTTSPRGCSLRLGLRGNNSANSGRSTILVSDTLLDLSAPTVSTCVSDPMIPTLSPFSIGNLGATWSDGTLLTNDPLVAFGTASATDTPKYQGQMSDAVVVTGSFAADTNISLDGHTWLGITNSNAGGNSTSQNSNLAPGTLFIRVA